MEQMIVVQKIIHVEREKEDACVVPKLADANLVMAKDRCPLSTGFGEEINCCTRECNATAGNCCTLSDKCDEGQGDCLTDKGCLEGLRCGTDNCNASLGLPDHADCCTSTPCDSVNGHGRCCTPKFKCGEGEGDCDKDSHCKNGLKCGTNNCPGGFPDGFDCCTAIDDATTNIPDSPSSTQVVSSTIL